ncbi:MAG TPA: right-handed parallel beta-helix repeat-containing protein [Nocardioides sp.]
MTATDLLGAVMSQAAVPSPTDVEHIDAVPNSGADCGPAIRSAFARAGQRASAGHVVAVTFPGPGTYRCDIDPAVPATQTNPSHLTIRQKYVAFDGAGATLQFVNTRWQGISWISDSTGPVVRNLTIDWATPPFVQGTITDFGTGGPTTSSGWLTFRPDPGFPMPASVDDTNGWGTVRTDAVRTRPKASVGQVFGITGWTPNTDGTWRIGLKDAVTYLPGIERNDRFVMGNRIGAALTFRSCTDVLVRSVKILTAPGTAITAVNAAGLTVDDLHVERATGRDITTTEDGIFVKNARTSASNVASVTITNSVIEGTHDDGINIHHQPVWIVGSSLDPDTGFTVLDVEAPAQDIIDWAFVAGKEVPDRVEVLAAKTGAVLGTAAITSVVATGGASGGAATIKLGGVIDGITVGTSYDAADQLFSLASSAPGLRIANNIIRETSRYGITLRARGDGAAGPVGRAVVAGNQISDTPGSGIMVCNEPDASPEGPIPGGIDLTGNVLTNAGYRVVGAYDPAEFGHGAIKLAAVQAPRDTASAISARDILVTGNAIHTPARYGVAVISATEVELRDNSIDARSGDPVPSTVSEPSCSITLEHCDVVSISGLTVSDKRRGLSAGVHVGSTCTPAGIDLGEATNHLSLAPRVLDYIDDRA